VKLANTRQIAFVFACIQGGVGRFTISLGSFTQSGVQTSSGGIVAICLDMGKTSLLYQVGDLYAYQVPPPYSFSLTNVLIYDPAIGGIPPFEQIQDKYFDIRLFYLDQGDFAKGHLTSFPTINLGVPENGSSVTLLSFAIFGLVVLRHRAIARDG
jgi:hypothetical protein